MLRCEVVIVFALCSLFLANGMPQDLQSPLPFLQFTNGGVRVNFGGYHAQAGLGGLLGGSNAGGGLHASAGTPWGAQAGAGLGGLLNGNDARTGGGLYARAGLGNGRPQAAAGLGGLLDGSGTSLFPALGGLFAGATTGDVHGARVPHDSPNPPQANVETGNVQPPRGHANIQIIEHSGNKPAKGSKREPPAVEPLAPSPPVQKEIREVERPQGGAVALASLGGAISINHAPAPHTHIIQKVKQIEIAPPVPEVNQFTQLDNGSDQVKLHQNQIFWKKIWTPGKLTVTSSVNTYNPSDANISMQRRASGDSANVAASQTYAVAAQNGNDRGNSFYDDVFNIPVSTLNAVNQLLNNNFG